MPISESPRRTRLLAALSAALGAGLTAATACDRHIPLTQTALTHAAPGETLCLQGGLRSAPLHIEGLHGTAAAPIRIVNAPGERVVFDTPGTEAIRIRDSSHLQLTGSHQNGRPGDPYGIAVQRARNKGIRIDGASHDLELDYLEVSGVTFLNRSAAGIWFNGTGSGAPARGLDLHHCYVHDVGSEGIYIGPSDYYAGGPAGRAIHVHHNRVEDTGWDAIQVGAARQDCAIHHNTVRRDSRAGEPGQRAGINANDGSRCAIYANRILDGGGTGVLLNQPAGGEVYDNLVVRAALEGIKVNRNDHEAPGAIAIQHNTVVAAAGHGIAYYDNHGAPYTVRNNLLADIGGIPLAGTWRPNGQVDHNTVGDLAGLAFRDPARDDYHPAAGSPAIDAGAATAIATDLDGVPRQGAPDTGAYEYLPAPADRDGDGIDDAHDNCPAQANPTQRDTDGDRHGNRCDPDFDNDGRINFRDLARFVSRPGEVHVDLDGDGQRDGRDLDILRGFFLRGPG